MTVAGADSQKQRVLTCPDCGLSREVSRFTWRNVRYGYLTGRCDPCARGRVNARRREAAAERFEQRFWSKVDRSGECWPWTGGTNGQGYGRFMLRKGTFAYPHRVAWELTHGEIPDGLLVCHSCDNPPCCNPAHLFLGTAKDNSSDMVAKGRNRGGRKPQKVTVEQTVTVKVGDA